jgi:hypothetical protein
MQMPNTGTFPTISCTVFTAYGTADGSPGPLLKRTPSGFKLSTSEAGQLAGTTVILHPYDARRLKMLCLTPKSYATTYIIENPEVVRYKIFIDYI